MTEENSEKISICDLMKSNTSILIKKIESQVPIQAQIYSDIYKEGFHMLDDLFGTCYISEKVFFDNINLDQYTLKQWDNFWKTVVDYYSKQIDMSTNSLKIYSQTRISSMQYYENFMHALMDSYQKTLSPYNSFSEK